MATEDQIVSSTRLSTSTNTPSAASATRTTSIPIEVDRKTRPDRTSFSSIKERAGTVAQSFIDSSESSVLRDEEVIEDGTPKSMAAVGPAASSVPRSHHGYLCPCQDFRGWKRIPVRGKLASKSFGDLKPLKFGWEWEVRNEKKEVKAEVLDLRPQQGKDRDGEKKRCSFEQLPMEVLSES